MALNAYLKMKGETTGEFKGSVTQKGHEGRIMVIAAVHEVDSPREGASGQAVGKRQHKPFTITKELDQSSPLLYAALVTNENISEWELQFYTPKVGGAAGGAGVEVNHYTVKLTNARIASVEFKMLNNKNPELTRYTEYEEVSFTYQKIEWIWVANGATTTDSWT